MPTKRTTTALITGLAFSFALVACGSDPVEVPKVAGIRLDDAHNVLKDAGFKEFEDIDAISDRQPLMDANWVVVGQVPPAGDRMDQKDTVTLKIAKPEDEGIREILPEDSPVLAEIRERDAATERRNGSGSTAVSAKRSKTIRSKSSIRSMNSSRVGNSISAISSVGVMSSEAKVRRMVK